MADAHLSDKEIEALGAQLVKEMHQEFQASLGDPPDDDSETSPRKSSARPKKKQRRAGASKKGV